MRRFRSWRRRELLAFAVILLLGTLVRVLWFGGIPNGINQDEASTLYDAWSLFHYGVDRHGYPWPVMLVSWGSGMYALASYASFPGIALFGLSPMAVRFPHLIIGLLSLPLFFVMLREVSNRKTALLGMFLLAVCPWHVMLSRWGLDSNLFPPLFLAGFTSLLLARRKPRYLVGAAVCFGLSLYSYGTAYVVVPLFLAGAVPLLLREKAIPSKWAGISLGVIFILALPVAIYLTINHFEWNPVITSYFSIPRLTGVARYQTMGVLPGVSDGAFTKIGTNLSHLVSLLKSQNDGTGYNVLPDFGVFYIWCAPFALLGLVLALGSALRKKSFGLRLLLCWTLAAFLLGAFVDPNVNRMNILFFPLIALLAIGMRAVMRGSFLGTGMIAALVVSFMYFSSAYFGAQAPAFYVSLPEAIAYAAHETRGNVCITDHVNMPYIYGLLGTATDPESFRSTMHIDNPGAEFQFVRSFDRFTFGLDHCDTASAEAFVAEDGEMPALQEDPAFQVERIGSYVVSVRRQVIGYK